MNKRIKVKQAPDKSLLLIIGAILIFGAIMIYDATVVLAQQTFDSPYRFVILHLSWLLVGFIGAYFFYKIDYKILTKKIASPLFVSTLVLLTLLAVASFFPCGNELDISFTPCINGARRWFYLNPPPLPLLPILGILGLQPGELAKLSLVMYLALVLEKHLKKLTGTQQPKYMPFVVTIVLTGLVSALIIKQPNLSTALLVGAIGLGMYYASGASLLPLVISLPAAVGVAFTFIMTSAYRKERLFTFLSGESSGDLASGYHIKQILIALGSGGVWGLGFGQSRQKFQYLPEVASDSIFAVIGEELGFIGTTLFIILFSALIYKGFSIANASNDILGRLLATGVTTWLAVQFFINIAAMTRLIPLTGVPIPLVSYGGSSTVFSLMGLGLLVNIGKRGV